MIPVLCEPWRAYSELEGLSDGECRDLVERRWRLDPPPLWVGSVLATLAGVVWTAGMPWFLATRTGLTRDKSLDQDAVALAIGLIALVGGAAWWIGVRWVVRCAFVARTLRRIVAGATCPRCRHSLIGLPITDDATRLEDRSRMRVRCPECGKVVHLIKHGYGPQDLAPWSERVLPKDFEVRVKR